MARRKARGGRLDAEREKKMRTRRRRRTTRLSSRLRTNANAYTKKRNKHRHAREPEDHDQSRARGGGGRARAARVLVSRAARADARCRAERRRRRCAGELGPAAFRCEDRAVHEQRVRARGGKEVLSALLLLAEENETRAGRGRVQTVAVHGRVRFRLASARVNGAARAHAHVGADEAGEIFELATGVVVESRLSSMIVVYYVTELYDRSLRFFSRGNERVCFSLPARAASDSAATAARPRRPPRARPPPLTRAELHTRRLRNRRSRNRNVRKPRTSSARASPSSGVAPADLLAAFAIRRPRAVFANPSATSRPRSSLKSPASSCSFSRPGDSVSSAPSERAGGAEAVVLLVLVLFSNSSAASACAAAAAQYSNGWTR